MISFSGIDCSGKSSQIELLKQKLEREGKKYKVVWSRGGYTPGIEWIKKIIRGGKQLSKEERIKQSETINGDSKKRIILFNAALVDLWFYYSVVIRLEGITKLIICDRYIWDTYIDFKMKYPEYDFEKKFFWKLTLKTMVKPKPSYCLLIEAEESMRRSDLKDEPFPEPIEVRRERIDLYLREMKNGRWDYVIDAMHPIEEVFAAITEKLSHTDQS